MKVLTIPELEYRLMLGKTRFCLRAKLTEEKKNLDCEILSGKHLVSQLVEIFESAIDGNAKDFAGLLRDVFAGRSKILSHLIELPDSRPDRIPWTRGKKGYLEEEETEEEEEEPPEYPRYILLLAKPEFGEMIDDYLRIYNSLADFLAKEFDGLRDHDKYCDLISTVANIDTIQLGDEKGMVLIPLDFCPERLALALNPESLKKNRLDTLYVPPMLGAWIEGKGHMFHAYRSIDLHPVLFPAIRMRAELGEKQLAEFYVKTGFSVRLLNKLKKGRRGLRLPHFELAGVLVSYLKNCPPARDKFQIMDLGTGKGGVLRAIMKNFIESEDYRKELSRLIDSQSACVVLLNDWFEEENTGVEFIRYAGTERPSQYITDVRKIIGDLREAVKHLEESNTLYDVCFINRLFDMYGKYGFYWVDQPKTGPVSAVLEEKQDKESPRVLLAYTGLPRFHSISDLQRQLFIECRPTDKYTAVPGVVYNLKDDFFKPKDMSFENLLKISRLIVLTIFPAKKQTVLGDLKGLDGVYVHVIGEKDSSKKPRYAVFCITRDKPLYDTIKKQFPEPES